MNDPQYEIRLWLQSMMKARGRGVRAELAKALDVRPDIITRMANTDPERESRAIKAHEMVLLEQFFGTALPGREVQQGLPGMTSIVGKAGAGPDGSVLFATGDGELGEIASPINASEKTAALEVEGDSMQDVAHDGSIIFYDERETPKVNHMGNLCVCWLEDDRVLIKYPYAGSAEGLFNLKSSSARTLHDVPVRYFAHVINIIPRIAAQKLMRRRPDLKLTDQVLMR